MAALDADAVVFGAPTYMGAASAAFKRFAEASSKPWADGMRWKDKVAAGFTNSQNVNGNKENTLLELFVLAAQHGMHWVSLGEYAGWNTTGGSETTSTAGLLHRRDGPVVRRPRAGRGPRPPRTSQRRRLSGRRVALVAHDYTAGRRAQKVGLVAVCAIPGVPASA